MNFHDHSQMTSNFSTFSQNQNQNQNQNSFFYSAPQNYPQFMIKNQFYQEDSMDFDWNHSWNFGF